MYLLTLFCCYEKHREKASKSTTHSKPTVSSSLDESQQVNTVSHEQNYDNHIEQFYDKQYVGKINMKGSDPLYQDEEESDNEDYFENYLYLNEYANELSVHRRVKKVVNLPLTITVIILVGYVAIGGLIFSSIEEWSFLRACYFSFTSLATIGKHGLLSTWY